MLEGLGRFQVVSSEQWSFGCVVELNRIFVMKVGPNSSCSLALAAMVVVEGGDERCPVISEWLKIETLVARASKGNIALVRGNSIDRSTVADNYELLSPLVQTYGN